MTFNNEIMANGIILLAFEFLFLGLKNDNPYGLKLD